MNQLFIFFCLSSFSFHLILFGLMFFSSLSRLVFTYLFLILSHLYLPGHLHLIFLFPFISFFIFILFCLSLPHFICFSLLFFIPSRLILLFQSCTVLSLISFHFISSLSFLNSSYFSLAELSSLSHLNSFSSPSCPV